MVSCQAPAGAAPGSVSPQRHGKWHPPSSAWAGCSGNGLRSPQPRPVSAECGKNRHHFQPPDSPGQPGTRGGFRPLRPSLPQTFARSPAHSLTKFPGAESPHAVSNQDRKPHGPRPCRLKRRRAGVAVNPNHPRPELRIIPLVTTGKIPRARAAFPHHGGKMKESAA